MPKATTTTTASAGAVRVALLCSTRDDVDELREVLRDADAEIVFEADTLECSPAAIRAATPAVVLINLPASSDEHSPLLDELAASPEMRVIFNDASITSALTGWDRARWRRHLSAKILGLEGDLPPRPDAAQSLRLPRTRSAPTTAFGRRGQPPLRSEQLAAEMHSGLAQLADSDSIGPPPRHDWASEIDAHGTFDVPLDSMTTEGVAQQAMGADMESTSDIEIDNEALGLNDDERELLGNLQTFDTGDESKFVPPQTSGHDEQRVDLTLDESAYPGTQVDDFPANDLGAPLGAADADLRLHAEVTSDEAVPARLDAPAGFAELSLAPLDAEHAPAPAADAVAPAAREEAPTGSGFAGMQLESLDGGISGAIEGRASFAIDTTERHVADLTSTTTRRSTLDPQPPAAPDIWILLGGNGSDIGMLELLGELPPTLSVAFVVMRADAAASDAEALPLDAWPADTALAPGQAVTIDPARAVRFDEAGRLLDAPVTATSGGVDAALGSLAAQYRDRLGLILFEGQAEDGCDGVAAVVANGGTVWSATTTDGDELVWNARALALGGLAQRGSALDLAQRLTGTTP